MDDDEGDSTSDIKSIIDSISENLKTFGKCDEFAKSLATSLNEKGIPYKIIRIDSEFGIYSDKAGMSIGTGYHYGVQVGDIVYDNMTTGGMKLDSWLEDLGLTQGFDSIKWNYTDTIINK